MVEPAMGLDNQPEVEAVVLNGAIPKLETAKVLTRGLGLVMGDAIVAPGKSMDEEIWGMGGCAPMLRLVELAKVRHSFLFFALAGGPADPNPSFADYSATFECRLDLHRRFEGVVEELGG